MSEPNAPENFKPYVPANEHPPEFTLPAVLVGAFLGIIFGASSLYLVLKVGMTVSASIPVAVLSITLFRWFSNTFGFRRATILENNIVQTAGSAGESIAFGVGVTMPALLLLGFEMDVIRVMTVSVLGGLLGILMMIPLRRAFIVKQHGKLIYPEGTACAEVLVAGEKGGATARMVFLGFGIAAVHKFLTSASKLWSAEPGEKLYVGEGTDKQGLKGAEIGGELSPELLGVGYLIGPKVACLMMAGAVLSYFVLGPMIADIGEKNPNPIPPATQRVSEMEPSGLKGAYLRYIGAGAVAAGGIISMCRALPLIFSSIIGGIRDLKASRAGSIDLNAHRTERDLPMSVVLFGSLGMVAALMLIPSLGLGIGFQGLLGAVMILVFGFLFVTVSSRLTGEIGSSSNPISGMTIATLLLTCIIFLLARKTGHEAMLTALTVAAVVCIASSNGGTTSQDLKTGYLVGATPKFQQYAILVGALTSALVIGGTMLLLDSVGTHYTNKNMPDVVLKVPADAPTQQVGRPHEEDKAEYRVVHVRKDEIPNVPAGRYLVDASGRPKYLTDTPIEQKVKTMDNGQKAPAPFTAPQPQLFASIIEGIFSGKLEWGLFVRGVLIAVALELAGVRALPFAVGMYLPITSSTPIFLGGLVRWLTDLIRGGGSSDVETETSPGVLLSSGYIAGGSLCGLIVAMFAVMPDGFRQAIDFSPMFGHSYVDKAALETAQQAVKTNEEKENIAHSHRSEAWLASAEARIISLVAFGLLGAVLFYIGLQKTPPGPPDAAASVPLSPPGRTGLPPPSSGPGDAAMFEKKQ